MYRKLKGKKLNKDASFVSVNINFTYLLIDYLTAAVTILLIAKICNKPFDRLNRVSH